MPATFAPAQDRSFPPDLAELLSRAQHLRDLLATGRMVESLEFVMPEKRDQVLAAGRATYRNPKVVGLDLTDDPEHVYVRVAVNMPALEGGSGGRNVWTARDAWVRVDGEWLFTAETFDGVLQGAAAASAPDMTPEQLRQEFESHFELVDSIIDVGTVNQGERRVIPVRITYSGTVPIQITSSIPSDLVALDGATTRSLSSEASTFQVIVNTERWEGSFHFPLPLIIDYKGVAMQRTLTVTGSVFAPLTFKAVDSMGIPEEELRFSLRNNTGQTLEIGYVTAEGKLEIVDHSRSLAPSEEGFIRLRRKPEIEPPSEITIFLETPVVGRQFFSFPFNFGTP